MPLTEQVLSALRDTFAPSELYLEPADCWPYGYDNSKLHHAPDAVLIANSHAQVVECVSLCNQFNIPLTTRGRGTGTTGAAVPTQGGIVLSLERMNEIIKFDAGNRSIRVQAGITNQDLQNFLSQHGFFWAPDPSSAEFCTIGGNLACNAAGPRAVKYGTTRENTLQLKLVTGSGKTITTGSKTTKGVVGLDLTRLMIGSEGTLGIITEAELKLLPLPPLKYTLRVLYEKTSNACSAIQALLSQPHTPCAIEFMDQHAIHLIQTHGNIDLPEYAKVMLMIELDGDSDSLAINLDKIKKILAQTQAIEIKSAENKEEAAILWQARKALSPILRTLAPNKINEDVVVPLPNLATLLNSLDTFAKKYAMTIVNFGHAGNGNLHVNILYDAEDPNQNQNALHCLDAVFREVIRLEGTISGEHGIGIAKRDFVNLELSKDEITLMHKIKELFDPNQILNLNKSIPNL